MLRIHQRKAIDNASVLGNFPTANQRIGILCLDQELHTLNGCCGGLGNNTIAELQPFEHCINEKMVRPVAMVH